MPDRVNGNRYQMLSKEEVRYRLASMPGRHCGNCAKYMDSGHCKLVQGGVLKYHTCDHFEWDVYKY